MSNVIDGFKLTFSGDELKEHALDRVSFHEAQEKYFMGVRIRALTEQARAAGVQITEDEIRSDDPNKEDSTCLESNSAAAKVRNFETYLVSNRIRGADEISNAGANITYHNGRRKFFNMVANHIEEEATHRLGLEDLATYEFQT